MISGSTLQHMPNVSKQISIGRSFRWLLTVILAAAAGAGLSYGFSRHAQHPSNSRSGEDSRSGGRTADGPEEVPEASKLKVKVVHPRKGGIARTTTQPGVLHAFEYADLYAKASGYLTAQSVDIGDTVERGQSLAEIYDPERQQEVEQAAAAVQQGKAEVKQAEARVETAEAAVSAAQALVEERKAEVGKYVASREYLQKEYLRFIELAQQKAIDQRVADEAEKEYESAIAAEQEAKAAVKTAEADLSKAKAEVATAKANVAAALAQVRLLEARETRANIMVEYLKLLSPYQGVVTKRNYHRGAFIRSADQGSQPPVLSVARTDLMRVVVYVPDRDVPYLDRGDEAIVRVDALPGEEFPGKIARFSEFEDEANRTMRAEIDLPNPSGRLREGMYGGVTILLEPPSDNLSVPSSALHKESESGEGSVYVVRGGQARLHKVRVGQDNGVVAEIVSGLRVEDLVVASYSGSMEDGEPVEAEPIDQQKGDQ
jgi:RND family efflux transporter MFP subunit